MAADGAWEKSTPAPPFGSGTRDGDDDARRALGDLQILVGQMEGWLASLKATPLDTAAAAELTASVEALGRKVGAADPLAEKLAVLAKRLQAQLGESREVAAEMTAAALEPPPKPEPTRALSLFRPWLVGGLAVLALAAAGVWVWRTSGPPPTPVTRAAVAQAASRPVAQPSASHVEPGPATGSSAVVAAAAAPVLASERERLRAAAERGDRAAMHALGVLILDGADSPAEAAKALRWLDAAAQAGDLGAREKAVALEAALAAEASAVPLIPPATTVAGTQALLARGGYYVGPMDGAASPALKAAAEAYLKDNPGVAVVR